MLNMLIMHADAVKIACLAQLVNVIAPIMTERGGKAWAQTIYTPFLYASRYGRVEAMPVELTCPSYDCAPCQAAPFLDASAVRLADGSLAVFLINRSECEAVDCRIGACGETRGKAEWIALCDYTANTVNDRDYAPVQPRRMSDVPNDNGGLHVSLPPFSWNLLLWH